MILINMIQCKFCKNVIVSRYLHDYKECSCASVAVDGGNKYLKRSFGSIIKDKVRFSRSLNVKPQDYYEEMSVEI